MFVGARIQKFFTQFSKLFCDHVLNDVGNRQWETALPEMVVEEM